MDQLIKTPTVTIQGSITRADGTVEPFTIITELELKQEEKEKE